MKTIILSILLLFSLHAFSQPLTPIFADQQGEKWGLIDTAGRVILPYDYDYISQSYYSHTVFTLYKNNQAGAADGHGKIWLDCQYKAIDYVEIDTTVYAIMSGPDGLLGYYSPFGNKKSDCIYSEIVI